MVKNNRCERRARADEENSLGFDRQADLVEKMTAAVEAWAGLTTPPPKAADPSVEILIKAYLANGGKVHTYAAYQTTPLPKILHPAWAGGTGIPPELTKAYETTMQG